MGTDYLPIAISNVTRLIRSNSLCSPPFESLLSRLTPVFAPRLKSGIRLSSSL